MRFRMEVLILLMSLVPLLTSAQSGSQRLKELYYLVDQTDSIYARSLTTFYLEKFLNESDIYRETWRYSAPNGRIIYFEVDYILDSTEFTEVYYLDRGNLICSEEYEKVNYSYIEDELKKGGVFYFNGSYPEHVVMLGPAYKTPSSIPPDLAVLQRFDKRYSELRRHIPMLPAQ